MPADRASRVPRASHGPRGAEVRIRPARSRDSEAIRTIYNAAVRTSTATFDTVPRSSRDQHAWYSAHKGRYPVVIAEVEGGVVGWASLSAWSERRAYRATAELSVYVATSHRGRGLGKALVLAVLNAGSRRGVRTVLARVVEGNPTSRALHLAVGFTPVGVMHRVGKKFGRILDVELLEFHGPAGGDDRR